MNPECEQTTIWESDCILGQHEIGCASRSMAMAQAFSFLRRQLDRCHLQDDLSQQIEADLAILSVEGSEEQLIPAIRSLREAADPTAPDYLLKIKACSDTLHKLCEIRK